MEALFSSSPKQNQALNECCGSESDTPPPALPVLPHELIFEILSRLPARTLIKFRCVCESFKTLISSPGFIKTHLKNVKTLSKTNPSDFSARLLIETSAEKKTFQSWSIYSIFSSPEADSMKLDCTDLTPDATQWRLVGSCDGLLCLVFEDIHVILWNPDTGVINKLLVLLQLNPGVSLGVFAYFGFGYNSKTDDYMVVAILPCKTNTVGGGKGFEIRANGYTLKTRCWKRILDFEYGFPYSSGTHVKGNLCWPINSEYGVQLRCTIIALDLAKETFKEVFQPDYGEAIHDTELGVLNGLLCVMCYYEGIRVDVWIMTEFGAPESWNKMFRIPYFECPDKYFYSPLFFIYDGGEVVFQFKDALVIYNPNDGTFRYPNIDSFCGFQVYIGSPSGGNDQHL